MDVASVDRRARSGAVAAGHRRFAVPRSRLSLIVYGGIFLWGVVFAVGAVLKQHFFLMRRYDLGNFTQAVWSTAHGHILRVTEVGGEQVSRLGIHVDPIIVGLVPLWWIWPSPDLLLVVQVTALAAGAIPLYWLGRKHLQSGRDAALISAAYLISPALQWNALHEFDAVALSVPLLLACTWFLDESRLWAFAVAATLAVLCQEQIGVIVACLGAVYGWRTRRWTPAAAIVVLGLGVTAVDLRVVLPHFSNGGQTPYASRLTGIGFHSLVSPAHLFGLVVLFAPVLALCFRSPVMLAAAPQLAFVLLSARLLDIAPSSQNILPILPFIFAGTIYALRPRFTTPKWRAGHVFVASLACTVFFGPIGPLLFGARLPAAELSGSFPSIHPAHAAAERKAVALVPPSAAVSSTNFLGAHLAARRYLYVFPFIGKATWIVLDKGDPELPNMEFLRRRNGNAVWKRDLILQPTLMNSEVRKFETSPRWRRVFSSDGVIVFKRRLPRAR